MLKRIALSLGAVLLLAPAAATAQTAAEHVAMGDRDHTAMNATGALAHYEAAIAADPSDYAALWRASREAVDLGEYTKDEAQRKALYAKAEGYAKRAVSANANDAEGHFALARAIGRNALTMGARDRVKYAKQVREEALTALKLSPNHAGALHVMGIWNAEIMRLSGIERFFAKNLLGGKVFGSASWDDAVRYMEASVAADPERIVHHLDLGRVYADVGNVAKAREQLEWVAKAPVHEYNDARYKQEAELALAKLK